MQGQIKISVTSPNLDTAKGHFTYLVQGQDNNGTIDIRRRFNDFYYLRQSLKKKFAAIYIPPVPQKMITGNKDQGNLELRRKFFDFFLKNISQNKYLYYCSITQQFLRNKTMDMEKFYTTFSFPKPDEILTEFQQIYPDLPGASTGDQLPTNEQKKIVNQFSVYLKKAQNQLRNIKRKVQNIVEARNNFVSNLNICNQTILPEYEKNVFSQYIQPNQQSDKVNFVFSGNSQVQENVTKFTEITNQENPFQVCSDMINYQLRQIEAMNELIEDKNTYQANTRKLLEKLIQKELELAKLQGGKTTFKSLFSKGNKDQQIQTLSQQIPSLKKEIQLLKRFCNSLNIVIASNEIPSWKNEKRKKYYQTVNITSQKQLRYLGAYGCLMKSIMQTLTQIK